MWRMRGGEGLRGGRGRETDEEFGPSEKSAKKGDEDGGEGEGRPAGEARAPVKETTVREMKARLPAKAAKAKAGRARTRNAFSHRLAYRLKTD